jgi:peptide/nickel transport system permease protein
MLLYLLKRLLLLLPALWLVGTVIFVLSRLIPGNYAATFTNDELAQNPNIKAGSQRRAYEQYLKKSGLDQPLFYVSLQTLAEPDTLYKVWQVHEHDFFKRLIFRYGNWEQIVMYYNQLQQLRTVGQQVITDPADKKYFQNRMEVFFSSTEEKKIQYNFDELHRMASGTDTLPLLTSRIDKAMQAYLTVQRESTFYKNLIPVVHWNGFQNQYHQWFVQLLHGDLGDSYRDARPVTSLIIQAINNTLLLSVCTLLLIFSFAFLINIFIANEDFKRWRSPVLNFLFVIDTVPTFLMALFLLIFLAGTNFMQLFPVYGLGEVPRDASWFQQLGIRLYHLVIPVICLTATNIAYVSSQVFYAMREVQRMDYITTARAKGLPEIVVVSKHVLRMASLPAITLFTGFLPALIGGALVIEVIFAIPGTGRLLVDAVLARDYPVILGIVLIIAFVKIIAHILADLLYYLADPRIRF